MNAATENATDAGSADDPKRLGLNRCTKARNFPLTCREPFVRPSRLPFEHSRRVSPHPDVLVFGSPRLVMDQAGATLELPDVPLSARRGATPILSRDPGSLSAYRSTHSTHCFQISFHVF